MNEINNLQNNQEQNKEKRNNHLIFILLLFVLVISIGYATLSSTLKIMGSGGINKMKWDIHFENISETVNKAEVIVPATIKGNTTDLEYNVNLLTLGSFYQFNVDIKNDGTIDAKLENMPTLSGISEEQDVYTNYTVTYSDGSLLNVGDVIKAGEKRTVTVRVEIDKNVTNTQLPTTAQSLNLSVDLDYVQAD